MNIIRTIILSSFPLISCKVQIFWGGHTNLKKISYFVWRYVLSNFKKVVRFFSIFFAFSQYLNFKVARIYTCCKKRNWGVRYMRGAWLETNVKILRKPLKFKRAKPAIPASAFKKPNNLTEKKQQLSFRSFTDCTFHEKNFGGSWHKCTWRKISLLHHVR